MFLAQFLVINLKNLNYLPKTKKFLECLPDPCVCPHPSAAQVQEENVLSLVCTEKTNIAELFTCHMCHTVQTKHISFPLYEHITTVQVKVHFTISGVG